jgi:Tfp pilus assembly protein PilN
VQIRLINPTQMLALAGIHTVLGIDLTGEGCRVVELRKRHNPLKMFAAEFVVRQSFVHDWPAHSTLEAQAEGLRSIGRSKNVKARFAVAALPLTSIRTLTVPVPPDVEKIGDWLIEHCEHLLKLPIPVDELTIGYEYLAQSTGERVVEVTFARTSEIDRLVSLFRGAGITLLSLGAGTREAVNSLFVSTELEGKESARFAYIDHGNMAITNLVQKHRSHCTAHVLGSPADAVGVLEELAPDAASPPSATFVSGEGCSDELLGSHTKFNPCGLSPEMGLAAGLAVKGLMPNLSPVNFLPSGVLGNVRDLIGRALFQRTILILGAFLVLVLVTPVVAEMFFQHRIEQMEQQAVSAGPAYAELEHLKTQVVELEQRVQERGTSLGNTHMARMLHDLARHTPDSLWFSRVAIQEQGSRIVLSGSGYARSAEAVTGLLKGMNRSGLYGNVNLVRTSASRPLESNPSWHRKAASRSVFEITAEVPAQGP